MSDHRAGHSFRVWMPLHCRAAFNCIEASLPALSCFFSMFLLITPLFSSHGPVPLIQSRGSGQEAAEVAKCHLGSFQASPTALQFPGPAGGHLEAFRLLIWKVFTLTSGAPQTAFSPVL